MPNRRWTDEDIEDLRRRVEIGQTVREIAVAIMRSQEATRARMQTLGLTKPRAFRPGHAVQIVCQLAEQ